MERLPFRLLVEILFKLDPKSLTMVQCTNRSIRSHISDDPYFKSEYLSRVGSGRLFHISTFGSYILFWHSSFCNFKSRINKHLVPQGLLASCSGLALLFVAGGLCVANPLASKSCRLRSIDHSKSTLLPGIITPHKEWYGENRIGLAVDPITQSRGGPKVKQGRARTQRFKIVCIEERKKASKETEYVFEVNRGDSRWKLSETGVTCSSSLLVQESKPVYLDGYVHWLRQDGSIIAFNPKTEHGRLIPVKPPPEKWSWEKKMVLAASDKELNLVTATEEVTCVYALSDDDAKWELVRRTDNRESMRNWNVAGYDGECLVVKEKKEERFNGAIHVYGSRARSFLSSQRMIMKLIGGVSRDALKISKHLWALKMLSSTKLILLEEYLKRKVWMTIDLEFRNNKRIKLN